VNADRTLEADAVKRMRLAYNHDAMCCPSVPIVLRYKLSFYGLSELKSGTSYTDRARK